MRLSNLYGTRITKFSIVPKMSKNIGNHVPNTFVSLESHLIWVKRINLVICQPSLEREIENERDPHRSSKFDTH